MREDREGEEDKVVARALRRKGREGEEERAGRGRGERGREKRIQILPHVVPDEERERENARP